MEIKKIMILLIILSIFFIVGCVDKRHRKKKLIQLISCSISPNNRVVDAIDINFETTGYTRDNQISCHSEINGVRYPEDSQATNPTVLGRGILTGRNYPKTGSCYIKVCCYPYPSASLDSFKEVCSETYRYK